jgi:hypothetical protein
MILPGLGGLTLPASSLPQIMNTISTGSGATVPVTAFNPDDQAETLVVITLLNDNNASTTTMSSVSFGGNALTLVGAKSRGINGANVSEIAIWKRVIGLNTASANLTCSASAGVNRGVQAFAFALKNCSTTLDNDQDNAIAAAGFDPNITTLKPSIVLGGFNGTTTTSWSSSVFDTEWLDAANGSLQHCAVYSKFEAGPVTSKLYTATSVGGIAWGASSAAAFGL